jgi:Ran GTPase-activating protein (RanGAP) involved in mRNA processing and transport
LISSQAQLALGPRRQLHLRHLDLSSNALGKKGIDLLVDALAMLPDGALTSLGLEALVLESVGITPKAASQLMKEPRWAGGLTHLNLSGNEFGASGTSALAKWLGDESTHALQHLELAAVEGMAVDQVVKSIESNERLKVRRTVSSGV